MGGGRLDYQLSPAMRLVGKVTDSERWQPFTAGNNSHAAATGTTAETNREYLLQFTHVLSNRTLNEVKFGKTRWIFRNANLTTWSNHWQRGIGVTTGSPRITFTGFSIGGNNFYPRHGAQDNWSIRDDFTFSYDARGRHDLKSGFDAVIIIDDGNNCQACMGNIDARGVFNGQAIPSAEQLQALVPRFVQRRHLEPGGDLAVGAHLQHRRRRLRDPRRASAVAGVGAGRLAVLARSHAESRCALRPEHQRQRQRVRRAAVRARPGRPNDTNNIQPRTGFACKLGDQTVVRGGSGLYFSSTLQIDTYFMAQIDRLAVMQVTNDGRPNFAADPFNGRAAADAAAGAGAVLPRPQRGRLHPAVDAGADGAAKNSPPHLARTWQSSIGAPAAAGQHDCRRGRLRLQPGAQREGSHREHEPDVQPGDRRQLSVLRHQPPRVSGLRRDLDGRSRGVVELPRPADSDHQAPEQPVAGIGDLHALRALGRDAGRLHGDPARCRSRCRPTWAASSRYRRPIFAIAPCSTGSGRSGADFQVSGIYYLGLGQRSQTIYGGDLRQIAGVGGGETLARQRLRPDGTIVPRNDFTQPRRQRVEVRAAAADSARPCGDRRHRRSVQPVQLAELDD